MVTVFKVILLIPVFVVQVVILLWLFIFCAFELMSLGLVMILALLSCLWLVRHISIKRLVMISGLCILILVICVLALSINYARSKGPAAEFKSTLNNLRVQAEIVFDQNGSYASFCEDGWVQRTEEKYWLEPPHIVANDCNGIAWQLVSQVYARFFISSQIVPGDFYCIATEDQYVVTGIIHNLTVENEDYYYCIDNTGFAGEVTQLSKEVIACEAGTNTRR